MRMCFKECVLAQLWVIPKSNFIGDPSGSRGSSVFCSSCCSENLRSCSIKRSMEEVKLRSLLLSQWTTKPPPPVPSSGLNTVASASVEGISDRGRGRWKEKNICEWKKREKKRKINISQCRKGSQLHSMCCWIISSWPRLMFQKYKNMSESVPTKLPYLCLG